MTQPVTDRVIILIDDRVTQAFTRFGIALAELAEKMGDTMAEVENGFQVLARVYASGPGPWEFEIPALSLPESRQHAEPEVYKRKPWLRLQHDHESGKMRRKGRG